MKKILDYIWNETKIVENIKFIKIGMLIDEINNDYSYYIKIKQKFNFKKDVNNDIECIVIYIYIYELLQVLFVLIVFIILYIFDIQLIPYVFINIVKWLLMIFFLIFIFNLIYINYIGIYNMLNENKYDDFKKGVSMLIKLINFIINMNILYWIFNINIDLFIQYNIIVVIDILMFFIFMWYKVIFDYEIKGKKVITFLSYPWIFMIINILMVIVGRNINDGYWNIILSGFGFNVTMLNQKE